MGFETCKLEKVAGTNLPVLVCGSEEENQSTSQASSNQLPLDTFVMGTASGLPSHCKDLPPLINFFRIAGALVGGLTFLALNSLLKDIDSSDPADLSKKSAIGDKAIAISLLTAATAIGVTGSTLLSKLFDDDCGPPPSEQKVPQRLVPAPVPESRRVALEIPIPSYDRPLEQDLLSELGMLALGFLAAPILAVIPEAATATTVGEAASATTPILWRGAPYAFGL